ncbi:hypothetical protein [Nonomuraea rubra]|uniref:hypothetical protein n=1 Tax=Nonomuraea rubra TaxID=46180 RepID=UPI0031E79679
MKGLAHAHVGFGGGVVRDELGEHGGEHQAGIGGARSEPVFCRMRTLDSSLPRSKAASMSWCLAGK